MRGFQAAHMMVHDEKLPWVAASEEERHELTALAGDDPRSLYDARYRAGYERTLVSSAYDACVLTAFHWALAGHRAGSQSVGRILDYGCGQGRYLEELRSRFPAAALTGTEVSQVAVGLARDRVPGAHVELVVDEAVPLPGASVDLVLCIDVIEHVRDASRALAEIARVLRPGGTVIVTTPCANPLSAGWLSAAASGGFEPTADGFGRFRTDDPAHLRRLRDAELAALLREAGLEPLAVRFWGHLGSPLADSVPGVRSAPLRIRKWIGLLDWRLARRLPNGGAMIMVAER